MKVVHSWLKEYVGESLPDPEEVARLLTFHAFEIDGVDEVDGDTVIDVDVLPNRSSDCLCHRGIAREIATQINQPLAADPLTIDPALTLSANIDVDIADPTACPRFSVSRLDGVKVGPSPKWLRKRLEALGQRSINNIVDATNYVMLALGQPLHAYDANKFPQTADRWKFSVRTAAAGEQVSLLAEGGKEEERVVDLTGTELLIVDGTSNTPIGLAGVKGGVYAGVDDTTTDILIEAAHFHPGVVRKTARRLGIVIDASKRFENEPAQDLPLYAQRMVIDLIKEIAGGEYHGTTDVYPHPVHPSVTTVRLARTNALIGLNLAASEMRSLLERMGATVAPHDGQPDTFAVTAPWERTDLQIEEDYIEEVGRIYGLDAIQSIVPDPVSLAAINPRQVHTERIRAELLSLGFSEVITSSFHKNGKIQLQNALASDKSYVRGNLRKNLDVTLSANYGNRDLLGLSAIQVFEIGTVFSPENGQVGEHLSLALGVRSKGTGYSPKDDAALQHAISSLNELLGQELVFHTESGIAELDLSAVLADLPEPDAYPAWQTKDPIQFRPVSPYPAVARDIALWVPEGTEPQQIMRTFAELIGGLCVRIDLFDEFTKDGRTSYAFRIVFQSEARTLTDSEVNSIMDKLYAAAANAGWEVR